MRDFPAEFIAEMWDTAMSKEHLFKEMFQWTPKELLVLYHKWLEKEGKLTTGGETRKGA